MSRRRLVFGDDGSASADAAWLWVNSHPWPGWTISVVTARPPEAFSVLPPERVTPHPWQPPHARALLAGAADTVVEHLEAEADPRVVLDSSGDADLMVVGPRGRGGLKHLHIGSTTEWLLARPVPPLAIVRSGRATERVLLCADGSRHARRAAETLALLPWISGCEVSVLAIDDGSTDVEAAIRDVTDLLLPAGVEPQAVSADSGRHAYASGRDVRSEILGEVQALDADLVALGTRGVGVVRRAVMGSTASAVALNAGCTVLVAYDPAGE